MRANASTRVNPQRDFWTGRSVLVTGHTGFKGAWLSLWLKRLGAKVTGFALPPDSDPSLFDLAAIDSHVTSCIGDVRDLEALRACLEAAQPEVVIHMAAQALVRPSYVDPVATYATNVMGTVNLLEAVRGCASVQAVVVVTSDKAYENREWVWSYREDEPMGGYDPYSNSKGCAELVTSAYRKSFFRQGGHPARVATARAGNVIGGGDWSVDRLVPDAIRAYIRGETVELRAPSAIRPWQHVLEPLSGYLRLAECLVQPDGIKYAQAWNFGPPDEDCWPVQDVVSALARGWMPASAWHLAQSCEQPHEATFLKVDASKARAHLGWRSRLPLAEGLAWTASWYRAQLDGGLAAELCFDQIADYEAKAEA